MITAIKQIIIFCDIQKDHHCLGEQEVVLNIHQRTSMAKNFLKKCGWIITENKHICPYCNTGDKSKGRFSSQYKKQC